MGVQVPPRTHGGSSPWGYNPGARRPRFPRHRQTVTSGTSKRQQGLALRCSLARPRGRYPAREPPAWHIPTRCGRSNPGKANGGCPSPWRWLGARGAGFGIRCGCPGLPVSLGHHRGVGRQPPAQPGVRPACVGGGGFMADLDLHQSSREGHAAPRRGRRESGLDTRARKPTADASSVAWHFVMRSRLAGGVVGGGLTGR